MTNYLGVDGGNSKTHAFILSDSGEPLGFGASRGSDFQEVGIEDACRSWAQAISIALGEAGLEKQDLCMGCFCLAGADLPEDYALLEKAVAELAHPVKTIVKNDSIAALRAGLTEFTHGVSVIVGAGFNAAGRAKDGAEIILPGLGYISGDYGGGRWIGRQMVRAVMRAWDGRGQATSLRGPVLRAMGAQNEFELIRCMRSNGGHERLLDLVPLLFDAAYDGDEVAQSLITTLGVEVGITAAMLISRLSLQHDEVPVILSTSVFQGKGPLLLDVITETVHRTAPLARVVIPDFIPVVGAALEAMSSDRKDINAEFLGRLRQKLKVSFPELVRNDVQTLA
ncbi:MAG: hypothetical protein M1281_15450 [Chloroflexi bacterium]|nr:hypothetical protein [Chloroflexota bacterium]